MKVMKGKVRVSEARSFLLSRTSSPFGAVSLHSREPREKRVASPHEGLGRVTSDFLSLASIEFGLEDLCLLM